MSGHNEDSICYFCEGTGYLDEDGKKLCECSEGKVFIKIWSSEDQINLSEEL